MKNNNLKDEFYKLIKDDENIFNFIQESVFSGLWYSNLHLNEEVWINESWWKTLGFSPDEIPSNHRDWQSFIEPSEQCSLEEFLLNPISYNDKILGFKHKSGQTIYLLCKAQVISINNQASRILFIFTNVSSLKRKELLLESCNHSAKIGYWELDLEHDTLYWSNTTKEIHEVSLEYQPVVSEAIKFYEEGPHRDRILEVFNQAISQGQSYNEDLQIITSKGNRKWVRAIGHSEMIDGKCIRHYGTFQDIDLVKNKEEELQQALIQNKIFIDQSPSAIAMFDTNMCYLAASRQWMSDYGLLDKNIIGVSHYELLPEISDEWKIYHQRGLNGESFVNNEDKFERADGTIQWIKWELRPWFTHQKAIGGIIIFAVDITLEKDNIEKLRINEESFRLTFENAAIGMALLDKNGKWLKVNDNLCEIVGYTEEELIQKTFQDITHPEDLNADLALLEQLIRGDIPYYHMEKRYFHKNGNIVHIILSASAIRDENGEVLYFISQITDITASKNAEFEVNDLLARLQSVLDASTQVSIIGTDPYGNINTFNQGAENLLGFSKEEMLGKTPIEFHLLEEVNQRAQELSEEYNTKIDGFETFVHKARLGLHETREWTYIRKDGTQFPVQLTVTAQRKGEEIIGYLGIAADISSIKEAERSITELLEVTKDQNARLKNFAQIVSHNLRSHATNFGLLLELLELESAEFRENEIIKMLATASSNLHETIMHLNEVIQINTTNKLAFQSIALCKSVEKTLLSISAQIRDAKANIENNIPKHTQVAGLQAYVDSILLNIITNALRYKSDKRTCKISLDITDIDSEFLELSVSDNGLGMDLERYGSRLFGMYKTFHNHPESRGIGLFMSKSQIEAMGGTIRAESKPNKGTTFYIRFRKSQA